MSESKVLIVKRNTAIKLAGKLTASAIGMLRPDVDEGSFMFNFDPTLNESSILLDAFDEKATREWNQHTTEPFPMKWWIIKRIAMEEREDGDDRPAARLVLISPDLETLSFVSKGALETLDLIRLTKGDGPYDPPVPVTVKEIKLGGGRRMLKLRGGEMKVQSEPIK